jgi:hypothetical protein
MGGLSQRSVALMIAVFQKLGCYDDTSYTGTQTPVVSGKDLRRELYARDFSPQFLDQCYRPHQLHWDFDVILPKLYDGRLTGGDVESGRALLLKFAEYLFARADNLRNVNGWYEQLYQLKRSLELDGFRELAGKLVPIDTAIFDQPKQVSLLMANVQSSQLPLTQVLLHHFTNAEELYVARKFDTATGDWRKFLEQLLRDIAEATTQNRSDLTTDVSKLSMKLLFPYLKNAGFFDSDEELAFSSAYGFLCSGSHPGVGGEQQAYLAMVLSLTFGHVALSKFSAWRAHGYKSF